MLFKLFTNSTEVLIMLIGHGETQEMWGIVMKGSLIKHFANGSKSLV